MMKPGKHTLHVGVAKEYLISEIRRNGARGWLTNWAGTDQEAISAIEADPRSFFTNTNDCDNQGSDGRCLGHYNLMSTWTALTICNPYPELIRIGEKPIENRLLNYRFRGRLFIHAGLSRDWMSTQHLRRFPNLTYGAITCVADVVDCLPKAAPAAWHATSYAHLYYHEHANGPYCLILENVKSLRTPVPVRGKQGLWRVPTEVRHLVIEQLREEG